MPDLSPSLSTAPHKTNMDALPTELKQRICSFLSPKQLKPLRLTCKSFATAAERYFINRFILFVHPQSLAKLRRIAEHEVLSKYLTTIVYDTTVTCGGARLQSSQPCWDDYRPKTLTLNADESYSATSTRVMHEAEEKFQAACAEAMMASKSTALTSKEYGLYYKYPKTKFQYLEVIKLAFEKCPRLKHFVLSASHPVEVNKARAQAFKITHSSEIIDEHTSRKPYMIFYATQKLESFTLIEVELPSPISLENAQLMNNLKHLHIKTSISNILRQLHHVFACARQLQTLSLFTHDNITEIVRVIRVRKPRACLLVCEYVEGTALINFLQHHAASLQRLGLAWASTDIGWGPVLGSIAGQLPAPKRVQLEALHKDLDHSVITAESAHELERFVTSGGSFPEIQYHTYEISEDDEDFTMEKFHFFQDSPQDKLPPGIWPDYEDIVATQELSEASR
ncbi:uncharacterized protein M437DRAFT_63782 [Aureobasidium melanogenum CBS 110374]|uniref:F-box domain-containing protein n=1 Tax=Aureobasidium melanogenum (strain CBS 110374) TaxID=1043003 RepID=A0A074WRX4_AURM1|nr:uncharacterized protein M437DRAFT_63782 [Aureobasidium melanogenum CBS 110374]KEQ65136.1 hypothetical protein M437DRAFT_63782 [Aureobasidium melanogenum CBS 110374]